MDNFIKIVTGINTAILIEYFSFRFHLAENFVLKKDYTDVIKQIFEKLDKILDRLEKKADRE